MTPVVLYDNTCRLCCGVVRFLRKHTHDGSINFAPLSSVEEQYPEGTVVFIENNKTWYRSSAVLRVFKRMGGWWQLLYIFIIVPPSLRDGIYKLIASNRMVLGGKAE